MSTERNEQPNTTGARRRQALGLATSTLATSLPFTSVRATRSSASEIPFQNAGSRVAQAPFGGGMSKAIGQYNRVTPYIANSGLLHRSG